MPEADLLKSYGAQGFTGLMNVWRMAAESTADGAELDAERFLDTVAATDGTHAFGSTPLSCATAPPPYIAVCNATTTAVQWDGERLVPIRENFTGIDLLTGTELQPGP